MRSIRIALGTTKIDPALLTHAGRLQHEGYLRREEAYEVIRTLAAAGTPIKEIVRRTGRSCKLVRDIVCGGGATCSAAGPTFWSRILPGSMLNGRLVAVTALNYGDAFKQAASGVVCGSSPNGHRGVAVPAAKRFAKYRRLGCSVGSC
jgi:hypothetical protein